MMRVCAVSSAIAQTRRVLPFAFVFLFPLNSVVGAHSTNGSMTGRVTDATKAAIVNATVAAGPRSIQLALELQF